MFTQCLFVCALFMVERLLEAESLHQKRVVTPLMLLRKL